ncbi:MAG: ATP-binding protein [Chitinophagaceae bacterium]|jgi:signal transduction histidine kinase/FixJ family two-component response regulator
MSFKSTRPLTGKIIFILLIACITLVLSWAITNFSFQKIKEPVRKIAEPNPQLQLVNKVLKDVVQLDQLQRIQASQENVKNYRPFLKQSESIRLSLDTLYQLSLGNEEQLSRIDTMKSILVRRDKLFVRYLNLRQNYFENDTLTGKIQLLSDFVNNTALRTDSNIYTTESKITATTIEQTDSSGDEKQGFWDKVFKRKKAPARKEVRHMILEQLKVSIDTLALLHEDSIINQLSQSIAAIESGRQQSRNTLVRQRMILDRAGNSLISQLLIILNDMENNELKRVEQNNLLATSIINKGLQQIGFILIAFILLTVVLATLIFTDIARSNRYRKELIASRDEAEHLGNVKQRFLANMSHELRTPLQAIIGFSEQMKLDEAERTQKNVDVVYQSSKHLLHVVNDVLDYSRISSGKMLIESKVFSVKNVVESIWETIDLQAKQKGLDFKYTASELTDEMYTGDPFRLRQILFNLLSNAIKFTEKGSVSLFVSVKEFKRSATFIFQVSDTGVGIHDKDLERIFSDFEQGYTAQMQKGSGLGLSIVKSLVEGQGGNITVSSEAGKGSDFIVSLSYTKVREAQQTDAGLASRPYYNGTVWVIDDDTTILRLCSLILGKNGINHQCFSTGDDLLAAEVPDDLSIILTDIRMPGMNGFELVDILKGRMPERDMKYVALTAQTLPDEQVQIMERGFSALLSKPFLAAELIAMILNQHRETNTEVVLNDKNEDFSDEIWESFFEETIKDLETIKVEQALKNFDSVAGYLHRIAGRCGQLGLYELSQKSRRLEINIMNGHFTEATIDEVWFSIRHFVTNR